VNGGVYQVSLKRAGTVTDAGMAVPDAMGTAEAINFQPTGGGKAAIAGDFVLTANEVNPVLRILRDNGIEVTALHNHMLNDEPPNPRKRPRTLFSISLTRHTRGERADKSGRCSRASYVAEGERHDDTVKLAKGLRIALD
jgi:Domain of Unknown Function (DUF1259)